MLILRWYIEGIDWLELQPTNVILYHNIILLLTKSNQTFCDSYYIQLDIVVKESFNIYDKLI